MRRGEIWTVDLNPTVGREQQGRRPVLIVSADDFNRATGLATVCPITSGGAGPRHGGFAVSLAAAGTATTGVVLVHQIRVLDLRARKARREEQVPDYIIDDVLARLVTFLS